jgi:hypothetical protein
MVESLSTLEKGCCYSLPVPSQQMMMFLAMVPPAELRSITVTPHLDQPLRHTKAASQHPAEKRLAKPVDRPSCPEVPHPIPRQQWH